MVKRQLPSQLYTFPDSRHCHSGPACWQANTGNSPFPTVLFVLPDERRKKHIFHYGKAKLGKTFENISVFMTTQDTIHHCKNTDNIWLKIE